MNKPRCKVCDHRRGPRRINLTKDRKGPKKAACAHECHGEAGT